MEICIYINNGKDGFDKRIKLSNQGLTAYGSYRGFDTGRKLIDINNDGLMDLWYTNEKNLNRSNNGLEYEARLWINNGKELKEVKGTYPTTLDLDNVNSNENDLYLEPLILWQEKNGYISYNAGTKLIDINNDGITDLLRRGGGGNRTNWNNVSKSYLGGSNTFINVEDTQYNKLFGNQSVHYPFGSSKIQDVNNYIRPLGIMDPRSKDIFYKFITDKLYKTTYLDFSTTYTDKLETVKLYTGKEIKVEYKKSSDYYTNDVDETRTNYVYDVVSKLTVKDKISPEQVYEYTYYDSYYYKDATDNYKNQQTGFRKVKTLLPNQTYQINYYHQGLGARQYVSVGVVEEDIHKKGLKFRTEVYDKENILLGLTNIDWEVEDKKTGYEMYPEEETYMYVPVYIKQITKKSEQNTVYAEDNTYSTAIGYEYNNEGNILKEINYGLVLTGTNYNEFTDIETDKREVVSDYGLYKTTGKVSPYITNKIIKNYNEEAVCSQKYYYDNLDFTEIDKGILSKQVDWNNIEDKEIVSQEFENNSYGQVIEVKDVLGNKTEYVYDDKNLYVKETINELGHKIIETRSILQGQKESVKFYNNEEIKYEYDGYGRTIKVLTSSPNGEGLVTKYEALYDDVSEPRKRLFKDYYEEDRYKEGILYLNGYEQIVQEKIQKEIGNYITTNQVYDYRGLLISKSYPELERGKTYNDEPINKNGVQEYEYDSLKRLVKTIQPNGEINIIHKGLKQEFIDENNNKKARTYDVWGNLVLWEEYNPLAETGDCTVCGTKYEYNILNNLIKITDSENNVREFEYDSLGRLLKNELLHKPNISPENINYYKYTYDDKNRLLTEETPNGCVIGYEYDSVDRLKKTYELETENCSVTVNDITYKYDEKENGKGRLTGIDNGVIEIQKEYDFLGRESKEIKIVDGIEYEFSYEYDLEGKVLKTTYPNNTATKIKYNHLGLPFYVSTVDVDGVEKMLSKDMVYNESNLLVSQTNFNNTVTRKKYDKTNLFRVTEQKIVKNNVIKESPEFSKVYELEYHENFSDAKKTNFSLLAGLSHDYNVSENENFEEASSYYNNTKIGLVGEKFKGLYILNDINELTDYEYELRFNEVRLSLGSSPGTISVPVRIQDRSNYYEFIVSGGSLRLYDRNNVQNKQLAVTNNYIGVSNSTLGYVVRVKAEGNVLSCKVWPARYKEPEEWGLVYEDKENRYSKGYTGILNRNYKMLLNDFKIYVPLTVDYQLSENNLEELDVNSETVFNWQYEYDNVGNVLGIKDVVSGITDSYEYDNFNRLIQAKEQVNEEKQIRTYKYSPNGNIRYKSDVGNYEYSNPSLPNAVTKITEPNIEPDIIPVQTEYEYDKAGNIKKSNNKTYNWDVYNRLIGYNDNRNTILYDYDFSGNRIKKTVKNGINEYESVYLTLDYRILPTEKEKVVEKEINVGINSYVLRGTKTTVTHKDHLGSSRAVSNTDGLIETKLKYYPYGTDTKEKEEQEPTTSEEELVTLTEKVDNIVTKINTVKEKVRESKNRKVFESIKALFVNKIIKHEFWNVLLQEEEKISVAPKLEATDVTRKYTGQIWDKESDLYYYNARYYNPRIGRFVSVDPVVVNMPMQFVMDTQQMNGYAYVGNNPVRFVDLWGLDSYILYDSKSFSKQAEVEKTRLEEKYGTDVHMYAVDTESQFVDNWNSMGSNGNEIDEVSLLFHGTSDTISIDYSENQYMTMYSDKETLKGNDAYYLGDLNNQQIKGINLLTCQGGNVDSAMSVAKFLAIKNSTNVNSWDGKLSYNRSLYSPRSSSIWSQLDYILNSKKAPYGEIKYDKKGGYKITGNTSNIYKWLNYFIDN